MAGHLRKQIRDKLKTVLSGLSTTTTNVFGNRKEIMSETELPAVIIFNDIDQVAARTIGSQVAPHTRMEQRTISYKIQALAKQNAGLDDQLDQICLEVEKAISADIFLGGLTSDARLISTSHQFEESSDRPEGIAEMVWEFDTWVPNTAPDTQA